MCRSKPETAQTYIRALRLEPHIEGGFFREIYKHSQFYNGRRLSSTIYYLLKSGQVSKFHRLNCDEIWFFHDGSTIMIHQISESGRLTTHRLGLSVKNDEQPQVMIPAHTVFGAELAEEDSFGLVSCMVSPGFEYQDFELFDARTLVEQYPEHREIITRLNG